MSSYPTLFDLAPPPPEPERGKSRRSDPLTSVQAGASTNASRLETAVYSYLLLMFPADKNTKELALEMGLERVTVSPRMCQLARKGKVERTGRRDGCETWRAIK